jgi:monoamine oxidase
MAGDHVTHLVGWQEGAALSAHRVVTQINQAFGGKPAKPTMSASAIWA